MDAPDLKHVLRQVDAQFPYLLQLNSAASCGEFMQRGIERMNTAGEGQWRHIHKDAGEHGITLPNGEKVSYDVAWHVGTRRQIDVINGGAATTDPARPIPGGVAWQEIDPSVYRPGNVPVGPWAVMPVVDPGGVAKKIAKLGFGWFCMSRAFSPQRGWPMRAQLNLDFMRRTLRPKYWRWFADVEGWLHCRATSDANDVIWGMAGTNIFEPYWAEEAKRLIDIVGTAGEQLHITVWGGTGHGNSDDKRKRGHDILCTAFRDSWSVVEAIEPVNEYNINGFTEDDVRRAARDLRSKIPANIRLACSSPALAHGLVEVGGGFGDPSNEDMDDSIHSLYGGLEGVVQEMTIHVSRGSEKWGDPFSYNPYKPQLAKRMNEPRGPGASAGGDMADPNMLARDYQHTCDAGWSHYTGHSRWSVWNGEIHPMYKDTGRWPEDNVWDHPNIERTFELWAAIHENGQPPVVVPPLGPTPKPVTGDQYLRPNETLFLNTRVQSANHLFTLQYQEDGNLVLYKENVGAVWQSGSGGTSPGVVSMQPDGNMVIYDKNNLAVWHTGTHGNEGASVSVQDDGNVVLYDTNGTPLWASETAGA